MLSEPLRQHLIAPRNVGRPDGPHRSARVTNPVCGDILQLHAAIDDEGRWRLAFEARGCSAVLAFVSWATDRLEGMDAQALAGLDVQTLVEEVGGLPPGKAHAADMLSRALEELRSG